MFKELQAVVGESSAFTMCLAVYVQVMLPLILQPNFSIKLCPAVRPLCAGA